MSETLTVADIHLHMTYTFGTCVIRTAKIHQITFSHFGFIGYAVCDCEDYTFTELGIYLCLGIRADIHVK